MKYKKPAAEVETVNRKGCCPLSLQFTFSFDFDVVKMAAAADPDNNRREALLAIAEPFRTNALLIIGKALELSVDRPDCFEFVDEILHSIFFLGNSNSPPFSPELIFNDRVLLEEFRSTYPRPFELFSSQVPRRGPFSCVLDMVVQVTGEREERNIISHLRDIISEVDPEGSRDFISSTICVSQRENSNLSTRYYGVSMSSQRKKLLIGASCLSYWHPFVANAVMTYYPHMTPQQPFNGTFILRPEVRCIAFDLMRTDGEEVVKPPCRSCGNLFGLETDADRGFAYGNCAEAESLSNLLKYENVSDIIREHPDRNSQSTRSRVERHFRSFLQMQSDSPITFYTPGRE